MFLSEMSILPGMRLGLLHRCLCYEVALQRMFPNEAISSAVKVWRGSSVTIEDDVDEAEASETEC